MDRRGRALLVGESGNIAPVVGHSMPETALMASVVISACGGSVAGFMMGLLPGLHINNLAAVMTANATATLSAFDGVWGLLGCGHVSVAVVCFLVSAMVAHMFSEAVPSTYIGLPSEDVISVLPAHRLARAGFGETAIMASALGSLGGLMVGVLVLVPVCVLMGPAGGLYAVIKSAMGLVVLSLSIVLIASEVAPAVKARSAAKSPLKNLVFATSIFLVSGLIGMIVFRTDYWACNMPGLPMLPDDPVPNSSLLLPLFAGLFGVPSLILSFGAPTLGRHHRVGPRVMPSVPGLKDHTLSLLGGILVGWIPGMTSGSSATIMSPKVRDDMATVDLDKSTKFIWLYSAVSASGAVLSIGALFVISRARSGVMDAVAFFLGNSCVSSPSSGWSLFAIALLLSVMLSGTLSFAMLSRMAPRMGRLAPVLGSAKVALCSLLFVTSLVAGLSGLRGLLLMAAAAALGILPPLLGTRRINLMGCLLVPVTLMFLAE